MATEILAADALSETMRTLAGGTDGPLAALWSARVATHLHDTYAGIPMSTFPEDLRTYERILWERAPVTVIEVGVGDGGSALWLRDRLFDFQRYRAGRAPRVIGVDVDLTAARRSFAGLPPEAVAGIELVEGDIADAVVVEAILSLVAPEAEVFVIDSAGHDDVTTLATVRALAPLIRSDGYLLVEDTCVDYPWLRPGDEERPRGRAAAVARWLSEDPLGRRFKRRPDLQAYGLTRHPGGLLQRLAEL
jgi:cephalosporin hydroxylase